MHIVISFAPVFLFLTALVFFDSYKLVKPGSVVLAIFIGCLSGLAAMFINRWLLSHAISDLETYSRYCAPIVEETIKSLYILILIRSKKVGFTVDSAIIGFAIGSGFAFMENSVLLRTAESANILLWLIRGFGTAFMHGGTTALAAILVKTISDHKNKFHAGIALPGLLTAVALHSFFNHFLLNPVLMTLLQMFILPVLFAIVFVKSERLTRLWLEVGLDSDVLLMECITQGTISNTKIGKYLQSLKNRFPAIVLADMLCYLRIHLELSIRAKGFLLMKESGFGVQIDPDIEEQFKELKYLEKSIGKTGKAALSPVFHNTSRDLWQIYMLAQRKK